MIVRSSKAALLAIGLLELLSSLSRVDAIELYIDAADGADTPTCGTVTQPCQTVNFTDMRALEEPGAPHTLRLLPGTYTFINDTRISNGGGWNRLQGDPTNTRAVVLDGEDTSRRLVQWYYSDNNQTGPFYFEYLTFSGFTDEVISVRGQHLDVRNCIFDFSYQHGAMAVEAYTDRSSDIWQEEAGSNTSTIYVENIVTYNSHNDAASVNCDRCYNATVLNSRFYNGSDDGNRGMSAMHFHDPVAVRVENIEIVDYYSCEDGAMELDGVHEAYLSNIEIHGVYPNVEDCPESQPGAIFIDNCLGLIEFDGLTMTNSTGGQGGCVYIESSNHNVTIRNGHFENCVATEAGGAIFIEAANQNDNLNVELIDCTFIGNEALLRGGAIEFDGGLTAAEVRLENCDFIDNKVLDAQGGTGGALNVRNELWNIQFLSGSLIGNEAEFGGAVFLTPSEDMVLNVEEVAITDNKATLGGAVHMGGSEVSFTDCKFGDNVAKESGGSIYVPQGVGSGATLNVERTSFLRDSAENGGSVFANGGMVHVDESSVTESVAGLGGAFFLGRSSQGSVMDTAISRCNVGGEGLCVGTLGYGAGVYFQGSACQNQDFRRVTFEDNLANVSGGAFYTQDATCGDSFCRVCSYENNEALGSGGKQAAPFELFKPERAGLQHVTLGERFFLDAIPFDAYDQPMSGNHELINAVLVDPNEHTNPEVFLCGDHTTTASRGLARFAFTAYLIDTQGQETRTKERLNSGHDAMVPLFLQPRSDAESTQPVGLTELALQGCPAGFEVDMLPAREIASLVESCHSNSDDLHTDGDETLPPLMQCIRQSNLTNVQRVVVLVLAGITLLVGLSLMIAAVLFRNNRIVWSSSPFMMLVAATGFLALEAAAFLRAFRPLSSAMCMSYLGLFVFGLNLLLGSAIAKNLRVWKIFTLKSLRVVHIANWKLLIGIVLASIPEIVTISIQSAMFPLTVDISVRNSACHSDTEGTFLGLYTAMKCLWLLAGVGTCWLVRKVPTKFNEWKSTALLVTFISLGLIIVWGIGAIVFTQERTILEVFVTALLAVSLISVCLIPKLFLIYKGRDSTLMSSGHSATQTNMTFTQFDTRVGDKSKTATAVSNNGDPAFEFKARFKRLREDLARTQKLYERSYENTQELRERFRAIESDLVALQFERDYRNDVGGEGVSDVTSTSDSGSGTETKVSKTASRRRSILDATFEEVPQEEGVPREA